MSEPTWRPGHIVWRELATPDVEAAKAFYGPIMGWRFTTDDMPGGQQYNTVGDVHGPVGGIVEMPAEAGGHPPHWMPYVSVEDVAATVAKAEAAGGTIGVPVTDIGIGLFAVIGDPHGGWITAWRFHEGDEPARTNEQMGPGVFCWETLTTPDPEASAAFYGAVFGWTVGEFNGMRTLVTGETPVADLQAGEPGAPGFWLCHVVVPVLADAQAAALAAGGKALSPALPVAGVGTIAIMQDPQGAGVSFFEPNGN